MLFTFSTISLTSYLIIVELISREKNRSTQKTLAVLCGLLLPIIVNIALFIITFLVLVDDYPVSVLMAFWGVVISIPLTYIAGSMYMIIRLFSPLGMTIVRTISLVLLIIFALVTIFLDVFIFLGMSNENVINEQPKTLEVDINLGPKS